MVRVKVPATTANLGPGFDCLGLALNLYNMVEMALADKLVITVRGEGAQDIARDETNIVYQAARKVFEQVGFSYAGLSIQLDNQIPTARGLGSSASAIVGGLMAANALSGDKLGISEILALATAMEGHPDNVAPALFGGLVISVTADRTVQTIRLEPPQELLGVVAVPDFQLSTKLAREVLPVQVPLKDAVFNLSRTALLVGALCQGNLALLGPAMEDRLHQPFRAKLVPGLEAVIAAAKSAGAAGVTLSGAGPSVIAFGVPQHTEVIARAMSDTFREQGVTSRVMVLAPVTAGAAVE